MYISNSTCLNIKFDLVTTHGMAAYLALVDSGATNNFIDQEVAKKMKMTPHKMNKPQLLYNVDGTENRSGRITHYYDFTVQQGKQESIQCFYIANLGKHQFILGYPWLEQFNPIIN